MQDQPTPVEILLGVAEYLRKSLSFVPDAQVRYQLRVAANALDIVTRELSLAAPAEAKELSRLEQITGRSGTLTELNNILCTAIRERSIPTDSSQLIDHLWQTTLAKVSVDQPSYRAYQRIIATVHSEEAD